jgi:hypothetical protein
MAEIISMPQGQDRADKDIMLGHDAEIELNEKEKAQIKKETQVFSGAFQDAYTLLVGGKITSDDFVQEMTELLQEVSQEFYDREA